MWKMCFFMLCNEGQGSFSPYDVLGHLIEAEKNLWLVRAAVILGHGQTRLFDDFDRFAHYQTSQGKSLNDLLDEFTRLRKASLRAIESYQLSDEQLEKTGQHPELGEVKLKELLATWVVHDLSHIRQMVRIMAKQYKTDVGPWKAYLPIFQE